MPEYRSIQCKIWDRDWVCELDSDGKVLWFHLITNHRAAVGGIYRMPFRSIAFETGISEEKLDKLLFHFTRLGKIFYADDIMWVCKLRDYQETHSPKVQTKITNDLVYIPAGPVKEAYCQRYNIPYSESYIPYSESQIPIHTYLPTLLTETDTDVNLQTVESPSSSKLTCSAILEGSPLLDSSKEAIPEPESVVYFTSTWPNWADGTMPAGTLNDIRGLVKRHGDEEVCAALLQAHIGNDKSAADCLRHATAILEKSRREAKNNPTAPSYEVQSAHKGRAPLIFRKDTYWVTEGERHEIEAYGDPDCKGFWLNGFAKKNPLCFEKHQEAA